MSARRCVDCSLDWPAVDDYEQCPACLTDTEYRSTGGSMGSIEARKKAATLTFEREYRRREEGWPSRCGPKRDTNLKQREQVQRLYEQGQLINQLERLWRD